MSNEIINCSHCNTPLMNPDQIFLHADTPCMLRQTIEKQNIIIEVLENLLEKSNVKVLDLTQQVSFFDDLSTAEKERWADMLGMIAYHEVQKIEKESKPSWSDLHITEQYYYRKLATAVGIIATGGYSRLVKAVKDKDKIVKEVKEQNLIVTQEVFRLEKQVAHLQNIVSYQQSLLAKQQWITPEQSLPEPNQLIEFYAKGERHKGIIKFNQSGQIGFISKNPNHTGKYKQSAFRVSEVTHWRVRVNDEPEGIGVISIKSESK